MKYPFAIWILAIGAFAIGMSEFVIIAFIGIVAWFGILFVVPNQKQTVQSSVISELKILKEKQLWLTLAVTLFGFSSVFAFFTYISSVLTDVSHVHENLISYLLIIFGVGVTLGNVVGGKLADKDLNRSLKSIFIVFILYFILLYFIQMNGFLMVAGIFFFGLIGFSMSPSLQFKSTLISQDAPTLASTLNQSAFNLGNALGAFIGGVVVTNLPLASLTLIAPILTFIGLIFLFISIKVERKEGRFAT